MVRRSTPAAAKALLAEAGFPDGFATKIQLPRRRRAATCNDPNVIAQDLQAQLKTNLNIDATIEVQESGTFIDNADARQARRASTSSGWGADYPDVTNFLDFHFGSGASKQFGDKFDDITDARSPRARIGLDDASREPSYVEANNAIRTHVPMVPICARRFGRRLSGGRRRTRTRRRWATSLRGR